MNEELKKLLDKINGLKASVKSLAAAGKLDEAEAKKEELIEAQRQFDLLYDLEDDPDGVDGTGGQGGRKEVDAGDPDGEGAAPTEQQVGNALVDAIRARLRGRKLPAKAAKVLTRDARLHAEMKEGDDPADPEDGADGGLTVPQDISNRIKELRRATADDLERYVNVENVTTKTGSRVIEVDADSTAWPEIEEGGEFQEQDTPTLRTISYKIKKFGGILKVTAELLEDTAENILAYLNKWIAKKSRATRNAKILAAMAACVGETSYKIEGVDDLKDIFNIVLDPAIAQGSSIYTNQNGFNFLDKLKDADGKYILQPDPTEKTKMLLFGQYPIVKLSNKVLKNAEVKSGIGGADEDGVSIPVYCGDLAEAITLFDRNVISLDISSTAGDLWVKDKTGLKVRDRFDVETVDTQAVVLGTIFVPTEG